MVVLTSPMLLQVQEADPGVGPAPERRREGPAERQALPGAGLRARGAPQAHQLLHRGSRPTRTSTSPHRVRTHPPLHQVKTPTSFTTTRKRLIPPAFSPIPPTTPHPTPPQTWRVWDPTPNFNSPLSPVVLAHAKVSVTWGAPCGRSETTGELQLSAKQGIYCVAPDDTHPPSLPPPSQALWLDEGRVLFSSVQCFLSHATPWWRGYEVRQKCILVWMHDDWNQRKTTAREGLSRVLYPYTSSRGCTVCN